MSKEILERWLKDKQRVEMQTAQGSWHGEGRVAGYTEETMVLVEDTEGAKTWWRADMCQELEETVTVKVEISRDIWEAAQWDYSVGDLLSRMRSAAEEAR